MKTMIAGLPLVWVSLIVLDLVFAGLSDAEIDPETVVGVWLFDEEEGTTVGDSSGNGHDGEIREGIKCVKGKFGNALEFPGLDPSYVSVPHEDSLSLATFTITAWVNMEMVPDRYPVVVAKFGTLGRNYGIAVNKNSEVPYLQFHVGGNYDEFRGRTKVTDKQWHHVAASYDNEFVRFYVDGILEAEMAFNGEPDANDAPLTFGGGPGTSPARGIIDEMGLFNAGLTADEINEIMTNGLEKALAMTAVSISGKLTTTWARIKAQSDSLQNGTRILTD